jgi:quercetin dioxygenase-like cupin family protein
MMDPSQIFTVSITGNALSAEGRNLGTDGGTAAMYIRKSILTGFLVVAIGAGWLGKTLAQGNTSSPVVTYLDHEKVNASFAKGGSPILFAGQSGQGEYRVRTANRIQTEEGQVHSHKLGTDVLYVVSGAATFVVGRTEVGAKTKAFDESRGPSVEAGESYHLSKGDVIIVPPGVPHWYQNVETPFLYFVVEVP